MPDRQPVRLWPAFVISVGALTAFFLPLSLLPAEVREAGFPPSIAAMTSVAFLAGVVTGELGAAAAIAGVGYRNALVAGLAVMAMASLTLVAVHGPAAWFGLSAIRGLGFAIVVVAAAAFVASSAAERTSGRTLGWYGFIAGLPAVMGLPLGLLLVTHGGAGAGHAVAAAAAALGVPFAFLLPQGGSNPSSRSGLRTVVRDGPTLRNASALTLGAIASGALIAYAPAALAGAEPGLASLLLVTATIAAPVARLAAGQLADRLGPYRLIGPSLALTTAGIALIPWGTTVLQVLGALGVGAGFGALQNSSLHLMSASTARPLIGAISALWNIAFDLGLLIGTLAFAALAAVLAPGPSMLMLGASLAAASVGLVATTRSAASSALRQR